MGGIHRATGVALLTVLCAVPLSMTRVMAQQPPPVQGVTGTIATEGTIDGERKAGSAIAAGAKKVADKVKSALPGGGKGTNQNPLDGFSEGRQVVVRDSVATGDEEPKAITEGVVIDVDKRRQQITVRLADRKTQTLHLTAPGGETDVVVSYTDDAGVKVAHDFKRVS